MSLHEALSEALGEAVTPDTSRDTLRKLAARAGVELQPGWNAAQIVLELYEHLVEARTVEPTFYRDFPVEVSPLTRQHRATRGWPRSGTWSPSAPRSPPAYSELVDPVEERARLTAQSLLAAGGDPEAMQLDEDFLRALEYGMPPSGGMGMGIDRMLIMLTGAGIRETVLFPLVKPT